MIFRSWKTRILVYFSAVWFHEMEVCERLLRNVYLVIAEKDCGLGCYRQTSIEHTIDTYWTLINIWIDNSKLPRTCPRQIRKVKRRETQPGVVLTRRQRKRGEENNSSGKWSWIAKTTRATGTAVRIFSPRIWLKWGICDNLGLCRVVCTHPVISGTTGGLHTKNRLLITTTRSTT